MSYSRKVVMERRLHFDQESCAVSASKCGAIRWPTVPTCLSQPMSVSWYIPKLQSKQKLFNWKFKNEDLSSVILMTDLMGNCVRQRDAVIFVDAAWLSRMTHASNFGQSKNTKNGNKNYKNRLKKEFTQSSYAQLDMSVQIFWRLIRMATSWWTGWFSSISLFLFCQLFKLKQY